jgi:hypothetical protein
MRKSVDNYVILCMIESMRMGTAREKRPPRQIALRGRALRIVMACPVPKKMKLVEGGLKCG